MHRKTWRGIKSSKRIPWQVLSADDVRSFVANGWRVRSKSHGLYVPVQ